MRIKASQKIGIETPNSAPIIPTTSKIELRLTAETTPTVTPIVTPINIDQTTISIVRGEGSLRCSLPSYKQIASGRQDHPALLRNWLPVSSRKKCAERCGVTRNDIFLLFTFLDVHELIPRAENDRRVTLNFLAEEGAACNPGHGYAGHIVMHDLLGILVDLLTLGNIGFLGAVDQQLRQFIVAVAVLYLGLPDR